MLICCTHNLMIEAQGVYIGSDVLVLFIMSKHDTQTNFCSVYLIQKVLCPKIIDSYFVLLASKRTPHSPEFPSITWVTTALDLCWLGLSFPVKWKHHTYSSVEVMSLATKYRKVWCLFSYSSFCGSFEGKLKGRGYSRQCSSVRQAPPAFSAILLFEASIS